LRCGQARVWRKIRALQILKNVNIELSRGIDSQCHDDDQRFGHRNATIALNRPLSAFEGGSKFPAPGRLYQLCRDSHGRYGRVLNEPLNRRRDRRVSGAARWRFQLQIDNRRGSGNRRKQQDR